MTLFNFRANNSHNSLICKITLCLFRPEWYDFTVKIVKGRIVTGCHILLLSMSYAFSILISVVKNPIILRT